MKKIAAFAMFILAAALTFVACSAESNEKTPAQKKVSIVATIYPQYDWLKNVLGSRLELQALGTGYRSDCKRRHGSVRRW